MLDDNVKARAAKIKLLIMDVDGVLTGGQIILDNNGTEYKAFHVRDGHGIKMAMRAGITVAIITGRESKVVAVRARELGIDEVHQKSYDKLATYTELVSRLGVRDEEAAFIGDDIVDIPVMKRVGLAVAVADAEEYVKQGAHAVTERRGGDGAVREVVDYVLKARGDWDRLTTKYFS